MSAKSDTHYRTFAVPAVTCRGVFSLHAFMRGVALPSKGLIFGSHPLRLCAHARVCRSNPPGPTHTRKLFETHEDQLGQASSHNHHSDRFIAGSRFSFSFFVYRRSHSVPLFSTSNPE